MAVESAQDRAAFIADFGEQVCAGSLDFLALIDDEYIETNGVQGTRPVFTVVESEVRCDGEWLLDRGDSMLARNTMFSVVTCEQSGDGMARIVATKQ